MKVGATQKNDGNSAWPRRHTSRTALMWAMSLCIASCNAAPSIAVRTGVPGTADSWSEVHRTVGDRIVVTRFFATWGGYRNPVTPERPVDLIAAQELEVYYECSYASIGGRDRLVRFENYRLEKRKLDSLEIPNVLVNAPFLAIGGWSGTTPLNLRAMQPADVLAASEYLFRRKGASAGEATHVKRILTSSREYRYSDDGTYVDFVDRPVQD